MKGVTGRTNVYQFLQIERAAANVLHDQCGNAVPGGYVPLRWFYYDADSDLIAETRERLGRLRPSVDLKEFLCSGLAKTIGCMLR